jgi:hypothetical protein
MSNKFPALSKDDENFLALPPGFTPRTEAEWTRISESKAEQGLIIAALKVLGIPTAKIFMMLPADRISMLLQRQAQGGWSEDKKAAKGAAAPAKKTTKATKAAPPPEEEEEQEQDEEQEEEEEEAAPPPPAKRTAGAATASSGDLGALRKQIGDLQGQLVELSKLVADTREYVLDLNAMVRIQIMSDGTGAMGEAIADSDLVEGVRETRLGNE